MSPKYRYTNKQFKKYLLIPVLKLLAVVSVALVVGVIGFKVQPANVGFVVLLTLGWIFFIHFLPILVLGIIHYQHSKNQMFRKDLVSNTYYYQDHIRTLSFQRNEIDQVIKVVSPPAYDNRLDLIGFGYFYAWKIILLDGTVLSLSCMVLDRDDFFDVPYTRKKRLFPV